VGPFEVEDTTPPIPANPAQVMLECIASLPFPMGRTGIAKVLAGTDTAAVDADRCRHFGALAMCSRAAVGEQLLVLVEAGYLRQDTSEPTRPLLLLTPKAATEPPPADLVQLGYKHGVGPDAARARAEREAAKQSYYEARRTLSSGFTAPADSPEFADRFERLRLWRRTTAQREGIPPFMVFHDRVLQEMAAASITSLEDLLRIQGVGNIAIKKYGTDLLAILADTPAEAAEATE
jgi:ATP-dependent DNA helicase RecQ